METTLIKSPGFKNKINSSTNQNNNNNRSVSSFFIIINSYSPFGKKVGKNNYEINNSKSFNIQKKRKKKKYFSK